MGPGRQMREQRQVRIRRVEGWQEGSRPTARNVACRWPRGTLASQFAVGLKVQSSTERRTDPSRESKGREDEARESRIVVCRR
jgi:hypothetical protein